MTKRPAPLLMPSEVSSRVGFFDKFAGVAARLASRAPFFAFCLLLVVLWLVQGVILMVSKGSIQGFLDAQYQLEINTTTTIITFLMVALLQNSQTRTDQATQHKLNAIADGLADLMEHLATQVPDCLAARRHVGTKVRGIGLETRGGRLRQRQVAALLSGWSTGQSASCPALVGASFILAPVDAGAPGAQGGSTDRHARSSPVPRTVSDGRPRRR